MSPQNAQYLRLVLAMLGAVLVSRNYLSSEASAGLQEQALTLAGAAAAIYTIWSARRAGKEQAEVTNAALALPQYATAFDLKEALRGGLTTSFADAIVRQAIGTVTGLLSDDLKVRRFVGPLMRLRDALDAALPTEAR